MPKPVSDLAELLATMTPELNEQRVAFLTFANGLNPFAPADTIGTFREREGLTVAADLNAAEASGHPILFRAAWITLTVHSDFEAVGPYSSLRQGAHRSRHQRQCHCQRIPRSHFCAGG